MRRAICWVLWMSLVGWAWGQQASSNLGTVPAVVSFSGNLAGINGKPPSGVVGVTFSLYADQQGGAPLWVETQNVSPDKGGRYAVTLGSTSSQGLPQAIFTAGEARWLGVQPQGQAEQPRVLLMSVPYAFKAGDASTLGGLPPSAFVNTSSTGGTSTNAGSNLPPISGGGKAGFIAEWKTATQLTSSKLFQNAAGNIGLGTAKPAANLDVNGTGIVRNTLTLFPNGSAPTLKVNGTAFNVSNTGLVSFVSGQTFPGAGTITGVTAGSGLTGGGNSGNVSLSVPSSGITNAMLQNSSLTVSPGGGMTGGGKISLGGSATLGLQSCGANQILEFVGGAWTCTNAATGTITGVSAGTDLTGGGFSGNVTLNLDTTKVPQLVANNSFTGNQAISGTLAVGGAVFAAGGFVSSSLYSSGTVSLSVDGGGVVVQPLTSCGGGISVNIAAGSSSNVAGGGGATAGDTVAGGGDYYARNIATGTLCGFATVGGGYSNAAGGDYSTVAGGWNNQAAATYSTVAGGSTNLATADYSTVAGGGGNLASGPSATVAGGGANTAAGHHSFAAGAFTTAQYGGSFVWGDFSTGDQGTNTRITDSGPNQFVARATGGVGFVSGIDSSGNPSTGVSLAPGSGSWSSLSDRASKDDFAPVDGQALLAHLAAFPVMTWRYKAQPPSIRHMGPVAQDFHAAFGLGEDDKHISTVDEIGVAIAALQELYRMNLKKDKQIQELKRQVSELQNIQQDIAAIKANIALAEKTVHRARPTKNRGKTIQTTNKTSHGIGAGDGTAMVHMPESVR